jgi:GT2 family glycosyltransferase
MKIVLIIPTFNESGNIGRLLDELQLVFRSIRHEMHILVVDDDSPDGTLDIVRARQRNSTNVHALQGTKRGLGAAYIRGMRYALDVLHAQAVLEMDADFSHKPADVPRLIAALEDGADFAIGSRYYQGAVFRRSGAGAGGSTRCSVTWWPATSLGSTGYMTAPLAFARSAVMSSAAWTSAASACRVTPSRSLCCMLRLQKALRSWRSPLSSSIGPSASRSSG